MKGTIMTKEDYMRLYAQRDREDKAFSRMAWVMIVGIAVSGIAVVVSLLANLS